MEAGLGMGSCEHFSEHLFRKGQASEGPVSPDGFSVSPVWWLPQ